MSFWSWVSFSLSPYYTKILMMGNGRGILQYAPIVEGGMALTGAGAALGTPAYMSPEQVNPLCPALLFDVYSAH